MKALFISTSLPPKAESQTIRNVFLIRGLLERGIDVKCITPDYKSGDPSLLEYLPNTITIHRTRLPLYDRLLNFTQKLPKRISRLSGSIVRDGIGLLAVPDQSFDWKGIAIRKACDILKQRDVDVIITSNGSFTALFAGAYLSKKFNLPWIADTGDPLALNPLPPLCLPYMRWINGPAEKKALKECSALTLTTHETIQAYQRFLSNSVCPPLHYLPCGYSLPKRQISENTDCFQVAYVGVAGRFRRDLRVFMLALDKALNSLQKPIRCKFLIVGSEHPAFRQEAEKLNSFDVEFSGWVSYDRSVEIMHESDCLLLQGNNGSLQIPGKVYNYLATNAPIVYIGEEAAINDPTHRLLINYPNVHCYSKHEDSPYELEKIVRNLVSEHSTITKIKDHRSMQGYSWEEIGQEFSEIVCSSIKLYN